MHCCFGVSYDIYHYIAIHEHDVGDIWMYPCGLYINIEIVALLNPRCTRYTFCHPKGRRECQIYIIWKHHPWNNTKIINKMGFISSFTFVQFWAKVIFEVLHLNWKQRDVMSSFLLIRLLWIYNMERVYNILYRRRYVLHIWEDYS